MQSFDYPKTYYLIVLKDLETKIYVTKNIQQIK